MKIGKPPEIKTPPNINTALPTPTPVPANPTSTTGAIPAQADPSAKIALSSTASTLLSNDSTPEFDAAKVASVSSQIDKGTYKINPEAIADKLISNAQELLSRHQ